MCYEFAATIPGVIVTKTDYSEQYQGTPNGEIQLKHFGKDASVSMEVGIVTYSGIFDGQGEVETQRTLTYIVLSDENKQNAGTTYQNLQLVLDDIICTHHKITASNLKFIVDLCDECSVQYKCDHALHTMVITATKRECIFFCCVKCPGHGKCRCDSEGGICKARADTTFDRFVTLPGSAGSSSEEVPVPTH